MKDLTHQSTHQSIKIDTHPQKALVILNDEPIGSTPLDINNANSEHYKIKLQLSGYNEKEIDVKMIPYNITHVNVDLKTGSSTIRYEEMDNNLNNTTIESTIKDINTDNTTRSIRELINVQREILKILKEEKDEGKAIYNNGTLSATSFTIIDTKTSPGHPVKGYSIRNTDNTNDIFVAHNITTLPQVDVDIVDTLKANPIFLQLTPTEVENIHYNINCIRAIHLLSVSGTATYKIKLIW